MTMTYEGASGAFADPAHDAASKVGGVPRGLPAPLPPGETLVWQGAPERRAFARQVFHTRAVLVWFVVAAIWQATIAGPGEAVARVAFVALSAAATLGILNLLAWLAARTTVYTVTSARTVMRIGSALPKTIDIPHGIVEGVALRETGGGMGNVTLDLGREARIAYALLWPHVRPWHWRDPQPMLRGVPEARSVGAMIAKGAGAATPPREQTTPAPEESYELRDEHENLAPRKMVMAMAALVGFTLLITGYSALTRPDRIDADHGTALRSIPLSFADTGPGAFDILDADGTVVASVAPGREGLIRNARRAFETRRARRAVPFDAPYALTVWDTDRLTIQDPETGQNVRIDFFGRPPEGPLKVLHRLAAESGS